jgi:hypothetical protein
VTSFLGSAERGWLDGYLFIEQTNNVELLSERENARHNCVTFMYWRKPRQKGEDFLKFLNCSLNLVVKGLQLSSADYETYCYGMSFLTDSVKCRSKGAIFHAIGIHGDPVRLRRSWRAASSGVTELSSISTTQRTAPHPDGRAGSADRRRG